MNCKLEYIDKINKDVEKKFGIYGTFNSMKNFILKILNNILQIVTYKCISNELSGKNALLVLMGYNYKYDKFELILIALLSHEELRF